MSNPANTVDFLSDEWLDAANVAVGRLYPLDQAIVIGYSVTDSGDEVSSHSLVLGPARVGMIRGLTEAAVTLALDWDLAVEINQGRSGAQRAFLDGRITMTGDTAVLVQSSLSLNGVDEALAPLRARTTYRLGDLSDWKGIL